MDYNIITLGCKVNTYESHVMSELLQACGYTQSPNAHTADITVINTCTVTSVSDNKNKKLIRRVRRNNPEGIIVLTGCMPQAFPEDSASFKDCDIVLGNSSRADLTAVLETYMLNRRQIVQISPHDSKKGTFETMSVKNFSGRTRAFVKIQDGCNRFCAYCIIPIARGRVRSKPLDEIKKELTILAQAGYKEIVLVGINLSAYGQEIGLHLCDAVECACSIDGVERIRLGSLEPEMLGMDVITRLKKEDKLCPQFHLSLQSGCDETLRRMNRHYTCKAYKEIAQSLRTAFKNAAITTDIMVGFPGETEEEFQTTLSFVREMKFAKAHVFPYSRRKGTAADEMPGQISHSIMVQRAKAMESLTNELRKDFMQTQTGLTGEVLLETKSDGYCMGYTKNYTPVRVNTNQDLCGEILKVKIIKSMDDDCEAELIIH